MTCIVSVKIIVTTFIKLNPKVVYTMAIKVSIDNRIMQKQILLN
jgi:hypothetical protein